jgi:hypothetical protein
MGGFPARRGADAQRRETADEAIMERDGVAKLRSELAAMSYAGFWVMGDQAAR